MLLNSVGYQINILVGEITGKVRKVDKYPFNDKYVLFFDFTWLSNEQCTDFRSTLSYKHYPKEGEMDIQP